MKYLLKTTSLCAALLGLILPASAEVLVNDTWADGSRLETNLPTESRWLASHAANLVAEAGAMTGIATTANRTWVTHYTSNSPAVLNVGDVLKATLVFTPSNVVAVPASSSRGVRVGLYNYSGGTRGTGDGTGGTSSGGNGVTGYMMNLNFAQNFSIDSPIQLLVRTNISSTDLMGSTGAYSSLGSGGGVSNTPAFSSGTQYTFELSVTRTASDTVEVQAKITGGEIDASHSATYTNSGPGYVDSFDGLAVRVNNLNDAAELFRFTQFKVEVTNAPVVIPPFSISRVERLNADSVKVSWESVAGQEYEVQSRDAVNQGTWNTLGVVTAAGSSSSFTNSGVGGVPQRYYRVSNTP